MPTYEITAPNGKSYRIDGPEGATDDQVRAEVLRQFPDAEGSAPKPNRAKLRPADARNAMNVAERELAKATQGMSPNVAADARRRMMADPRISGLQAAMQGEAPPPKRASLGEDMLTSAKSVLGNIGIGMATIPDALAAGGDMVTNAIGGVIGAGGGAVLRAHGANDAADKFGKFFAPHRTRTLGEMIQKVTPPSSYRGGDVAAQMLGGALVPLPGMKSAPTARLPQVMAKQAPNAAQSLVQEGARNTVRVLTSDVKPPRTATGKLAQTLGEKVPFLGTGGVRAAQQGERIEAVKNVLREFGGDDGVHLFDDASTAVDDVAKSLSAKRSAELSKFKKAKIGVIEGLSKARNRLDEWRSEGNERFFTYTADDGTKADIHLILGADGRAEIAVNPNLKVRSNQFGPAKIRQAMAEIKERYPGITTFFGERETGAGVGRMQVVDAASLPARSRPVPVSNAIQAIDAQIANLTQRGTKPALEVAETLKGYRASLQGKTLGQLEAIRADELSNVFKGGDTLADIKAVGEKAIRAIYDPLRKDMGDFIRSEGGAAAFAKWSNANKRLSAMAGELDNAALRNVLKTSEMTPENVGRLLFSKNRSDVARLYGNLDDFGKSRAQAAVLQRAFDRAISADRGLSVERFVNNVTGLGDSVGVVFTGADKARIEGLTRLLDATRRAASGTALPATGAQNTPIAGGFALGTVFGNAAIPVAALGGLLARAYESAPVRNALLKLGKASAGSKAEGIAIKRVTELLAKSSAGAMRAIAPAANDTVPVAALAGESPEDQQGQ